jgi:uncharacterized protein (TIGR02611 family)
MKRRTKPEDVWGDEPSERDASATLAEMPADEVDRRWHDHTAIFPFKVVLRFLARNAKRIGVAIAGGVLILIGVALLVLPGPGWLFIFLGLGVLATEFVWAERMLNKAKQKAQEAKDAVARRRGARATKRAERRSTSTTSSITTAAESPDEAESPAAGDVESA